ncbi:2,3-dihydroxyphenylpropionate/2,3-dihydroxicinnamic acid 1,2-dioxygenase [bioreactor metagenome]|uniref:2,3-dihydroxyphenylpropionate/2, 3-dihydroxicinnamic acid 1,2-dioxygenase n=2 Tax=root TaxID=1 RepID=A0A645ATT6_9ZZZZ
MRERFFAAMGYVRGRVHEAGAQAVVLMSGEHFTNFFLDNLPQLSVGLGESHLGPVEKWLGIPRTLVPGDPGLGSAILAGTVRRGFQPSLASRLTVDHGFMTVYHELSPAMDLPLVPIVMNCTTPPLMTLRQAYDFGAAVGEAIRAYAGLDRVVLMGAGGLSHFVGEPRVGDIDEDFDLWFLRQLELGCPPELLDIDNDELMIAGNGTGEVRAWAACAGAMQGSRTTALAYEPISEWINGMGVVLHEPAGREAVEAPASIFVP